MQRKRVVTIAVTVLSAALATPAAAQAGNNCCFELAVDHEALYRVDYHDDGYGLDGEYAYSNRWWLRAIVEYREGDGGELVSRRAHEQVDIREFSNVTRCKPGDGDQPCVPPNRELWPCPGTPQPDGYGGFYYASGASTPYARGGNVSISDSTVASGARLRVLPSDSTYYQAYDALACSFGHEHHGYGERGDDVGGERQVELKPPARRFMRLASGGDRCVHSFSDSLSLGDDHPGSDTPGGHSWSSQLSVDYRLSYFPRSELRRKKRQVKGIDEPSRRDGWGGHWRGKREC